MATPPKATALWMLLVASACLCAQTSGRLTARLAMPDGSAALGIETELVLPPGEKAFATQKSGAGGLLIFPSLPAGEYELRTGNHQVLRGGVQVFATEETDLGIVILQPKAASNKPGEPAIAPQGAAEVSTLLTREQVEQLPVLGRDPTRLVGTVAGAGMNSRSNTFLNGTRPDYTMVTLDGVNILDEFDRRGLDSAAEQPLVDQVAEMSIVTANPSAPYGFGYPHVVMLTPSGTNQYHGSLYWQNRNSDFAANNWFNNRDGVNRPFLNKNNFGGTLGGPIIKDRLLAYVNYEGARTSQQTRVDRTILTADARQGIYTYQDAGGAVHKVNLLQAAGVQPDPAIQQLLQAVPGPGAINNFLTGDSRPDLLRNTAGYSYNLGAKSDSDNLSTKLDWRLSPRHTLFGTYFLQRSSAAQPNLSSDFAPVSKIANVVDADLFSIGWRWQASPTWSVETRAGHNGYSNLVDTSEKFGSYLLSIPLINNPVNPQPPYGRYGSTWNVASIASHTVGRHLIELGYQWQGARSQPFDQFNLTPTCTLGIGTGNPGLTLAALPGLPSNELAIANALLALDAGYVTNCFRSFNAQSRTSGFVPGAENQGDFSWGIHAAFVQDQWKIHPRLTLSLGLRYELPTVVDVRNGLLLLPVEQDNDPLGTLRANLQLDFTGPGTGHQPYHADRNNFAPQVGLAFRVDQTGNTILRAGYGISYVEDISAPLMLTGLVNEGLHRLSAVTGTSARVSSSLPSIPTPAFQVPVTLAANYQFDPTQGVVLPDPNLRTPYIQQWNVGLERRFSWATVEARYAGNHAVGLLRGFDENQVILQQNGFLDDFQRAAQNGLLSLAATGAYNPSYNAAIPGSSVLTVFPKLLGGGLLTSPTIQSLIITGQPAGLAATYQLNGLNGAVNFFPNPNAYQTWLLENHDQSTYNSLQLEFHTRGRSHFLAASYVFSKVLSDSLGTSANRLEAFLDINNASLDRARPAFDQTHAVKLAGVWDLPFGPGHRLNHQSARRLLEGWSLSGILLVQSGAPFSILSARATLSLATLNNSVNTPLTMAQLNNVVGFRQTGTGPSIISASAIGPDGRGVAPDGLAPFAGQVFFNPPANGFGTLQRRVFNGPVTVFPVAALGKTTRITERQSVEFRLEAVNVLNRPNWIVGDQVVNSSLFGKIGGAMDPRVVQFNLYYRF